MAKNIDDRIASAAKAKDDAKRAYNAEQKKGSAKLLSALLKRPLAERFAALVLDEPSASALIAADRLKLLRSMHEPAGKILKIDTGFASWFEVFRSRLRYRTPFWFFVGIFAAASAVYLVIAFQHTPIAWVEIAGTEPQTVSILHPDGYRTDERLYPRKHRYQLMRIADGVGQLRNWVPTQGYEYFLLPQSEFEIVKPIHSDQ